MPHASSPRIASVATALPPNVCTADDCRALLPALAGAPELADRWRDAVTASRIQRRHTVAPLPALLARRSLDDRAEDYARFAVELASTAAARALAAADLDPGAIGTVVSVSCTGYMLPSLDAFLVSRLGLAASVRRVPLTELGCSGGVAALGLAGTLATERPVLVVSVEPCSLCLQPVRPTSSDLYGALLFGDGAAAAVVLPASAAGGPALLGSRSTLWPDSLGLLGMRLSSTGFRFRLSPELPTVVAAEVRPTVVSFLAAFGLAPSDVGFWVVHPGGPKVLETVAASLGLPDAAVASSWTVWEQCGNLSSASVFFILHHLASAAAPAPGALGVMVAFGPGVTCELTLLAAHGWLAAGYSNRSASETGMRLEA
jgi:alkylresorcinol/alkylpyrone synthase